MHDRKRILRELRRRDFLKAAGASVGASVVGAGTVGAQTGIADGPSAVGPFRAAEVDPATLPTPEFRDDPDIVDEGSAESEEVPRGQPDGDADTKGPTPEPQTGTSGSGLTVQKEFDGFTTRDVVRGVDFDDSGEVTEEEIFFGVPSDNQLATGRDHHVTAINSEIGFIEKGAAGDGANRQGGHLEADNDYITQYRLEHFFEPVLSLASGDEDGDDKDDESDPFQFENTIVFDPRARFDPEVGDNGRFYVACVEFNLPDEKDGTEVKDSNDWTGAFLLAVSSSDDPNDPWTVYRIPTEASASNQGLVDYPTLGYDGDAVYLAQNFFSWGFVGATLTVLDKEDLIDGNDVGGWEFSGLRNPDGSLAFTLQPAAMPGESRSFYLANSRYGNGQTVTVWEVDASGEEPSIDNASVSVPPYANAPAAQQPGSNKKVDTLDTRLMNLAWDGDSLWTAHTTAEGYVRWYEIGPGAGFDPGVVQQGAYQRNNWATFLPTVEAAGGEMVLVHNVGAETEYAGVEVTGRTESYDDGELQDHEVVQRGEVAYNYDDSDGSIGPGGEENVLRWGDYNGAAVDPKDESFWVIGQYAKDPSPDSEGPAESELYGTRIANVTFD